MGLSTLISANLLLADIAGKAYKLAGKLDFRGLPISIESKKGQVRKGIGKDGKQWKVVMPFDYGYIRGTEGADGQHVDCFIGPDKDADEVYVIHQCKEDDKSKYDEDKVMLGFKSLEEAIKAYKSAYVGVDLFKGSHTFNFEDFVEAIHQKSNRGELLECVEDNSEAWIGFDLDGTLAYYDKFEGPTVIGAPILKMVKLVEEYLSAGKIVKIFTARVDDDPDGKVKEAIEQWCEENIGVVLPITNAKDHNMVELYDDRAHHVEKNTGEVCASCESGDCDLHAGGPGSGWFSDKGHIKHNFDYPKGREWKPGETKSEVINGLKLKPAKNVDYSKLVDHSIQEPEKISRPKVTYTDKKTGETLSYSKHAAAGVIVVEPDNKVWLYAPKNFFGGYVNTFSKGTIDKGEDPQTAAVRELHEETGLVAKIKGYLGDVERSTSVTRYYVGERVGGHPGGAQPDETHNVQLVPIDKDLAKRLMDVDGKTTADHDVLDLLNKHLGNVEESDPTNKVDFMAKQVTGQKGSNPGGTYKGSDGVDRYVKFYGNPDRGRGECVANTIYNDLGIGAPKSTIFTAANGKQAFASEIIPGGKILNEEGLNKENSQAILKGFAADVLTANWDAVGLVHDNILMKGGVANRIDNGAVFNYRAQGEQKPSGLLNKISEFEGLAPGGINKEYAQVFKAAGYKSAMDIPDIKQQVQSIVNLEHAHGSWEDYLDKKAPYLGDKQKSLIADMLSSRTELLAQKVGVKGPSNIKAESDLETLYRIAAGGPGSGWYADNGHVGHGSMTTYKNLKKSGWKPVGTVTHPALGQSTNWTHKFKPNEIIFTHDNGWQHQIAGKLVGHGNTTVALKEHLGMKLKGKPAISPITGHPFVKGDKLGKAGEVKEYGDAKQIKVLKDSGYVATDAGSTYTTWKQPGELFDTHSFDTYSSGTWKQYDKNGALDDSGSGPLTLSKAIANATSKPVGVATSTGSKLTVTPSTPSAAKTPAGVTTQVPAQNKIDAIKALGYNLTANKGDTDVYTKPGEQYEVHLVPTDLTHSKFNIVDGKTGKVLDTGTYANEVQTSLTNLKSQVLAGKAVGVTFPSKAKQDVDAMFHVMAGKVVSKVYDSYAGQTDKQKYANSQIEQWKNNFVDAVSKGAKPNQATSIKAATGLGVYPEAAAKLGISPQQVKDTQALISNWSGSSKDSTRLAFNNATHGKDGANPGDVLEYQVTQNFLAKKYPSGNVDLTRGMEEKSSGLGKQISAFKAIANADDVLPDWNITWKSGGAESWTTQEDNHWADVRIRTNWPTSEVFSTHESNPVGLSIASEKEYIVAPKDYQKVLSKSGPTKAKIWSAAAKLPADILRNIAYLQLHGWTFDIDYDNHTISFKEGPDIYSGISAEDAGTPTQVSAGGPGSGRHKELGALHDAIKNSPARTDSKLFYITHYSDVVELRDKIAKLHDDDPLLTKAASLLQKAKSAGRRREYKVAGYMLDDALNRLHGTLSKLNIETYANAGHMDAGGPGSGWTEEGGHVSHKAKVAKSSIKGKTKEQFNIRMQVTAESSEQVLASVLGGKSYNDTEPVDIVVKTGGRLIGIEVKTLLFQKNDKITMNHGAIPRKLKWQKKTGAELYTVAVDARTPNKITCYVRPGVGSWDLKYMAKVGSFKDVKKFLEIGKQTDDLPTKLPKSKAALGMPKDHQWEKPSKALRNFSVLDHLHSGGPGSGWFREGGHVGTQKIASKDLSSHLQSLSKAPIPDFVKHASKMLEASGLDKRYFQNRTMSKFRTANKLAIHPLAIANYNESKRMLEFRNDAGKDDVTHELAHHLDLTFVRQPDKQDGDKVAINKPLAAKVVNDYTSEWQAAKDKISESLGHRFRFANDYQKMEGNNQVHKTAPTLYALDGPKEWFAESFSQYVKGGQARQHLEDVAPKTYAAVKTVISGRIFK